MIHLDSLPLTSSCQASSLTCQGKTLTGYNTSLFTKNRSNLKYGLDLKKKLHAKDLYAERIINVSTVHDQLSS